MGEVVKGILFAYFLWHHQEYVDDENVMTSTWFGQILEEDNSNNCHCVPKRCQDQVKYIIYLI